MSNSVLAAGLVGKRDVIERAREYQRLAVQGVGISVSTGRRGRA